MLIFMFEHFGPWRKQNCAQIRVIASEQHVHSSGGGGVKQPRKVTSHLPTAIRIMFKEYKTEIHQLKSKFYTQTAVYSLLLVPRYLSKFWNHIRWLEINRRGFGESGLILLIKKLLVQNDSKVVHTHHYQKREKTSEYCWQSDPSDAENGVWLKFAQNVILSRQRDFGQSVV